MLFTNFLFLLLDLLFCWLQSIDSSCYFFYKSTIYQLIYS